MRGWKLMFKNTIACLILLMSYNSVVEAIDRSKAIARVAFVRGNVQAIDNNTKESRKLVRDDIVFKQETISVSNKGLAQLVFTDKSMLYLKANTTVSLVKYKFVKGKPDESGSLTELLKGSMRSITGTIGKERPGNVKFKNKVATIGIRGTAIELKANSVTFDFGKGFMETGGGTLELTEGESAKAKTATVTPGKFFVLRKDKDPVVISRLLTDIKSTQIPGLMSNLCDDVPMEAAVLLMGMESQISGFNQRIATQTVKGLKGCLNKEEVGILLTSSVLLYPDMAPSLLKVVTRGPNSITVKSALRSTLKGMVNPSREQVNTVLKSAVVNGDLNKEEAKEVLKEMQELGYCAL